MHEHRATSTRWTWAATGLLLGFGAPAGAFLLRLLLVPSTRDGAWSDLRANAFFYVYSLVATCLVFAVAGYVAGVRADRLERAEAFYHRLSEHDPLTGLLNGRVFHDRYRRAVKRAARLGDTIALLMIDVDHLKLINESRGHAAGSAALVRVADAIRAAKRASDTAARWGGDEFAVLLEGGNAEAAQRTAEGIRKFLAGARGTKPVTVTIGITAAVPAEDGADELFAAADAALYAGKREGRNRVTVA